MWMGEEGMTKRANRLMEQGRRKRGRPWLRLEDCVRRGIRKVVVVGERIELAQDRGRWRSYRGQGRAEAW